MKVVFNKSDHGLGLSDIAKRRLFDMGLTTDDVENLHRHDQHLIRVIEELGDRASSDTSNLRIAQLDGTSYIITKDNYREHVFLPEEYNFK
jgi:hypothetical protein